MKKKYLKHGMVIIIFCISVFFCLKNEPTRSLFLNTEIDTVIVLNSGEKYREQDVEFNHNYKGKIYTRKVVVDTLLRRFYNVGDTMVVSYLKDDPSTISYHNRSILGSIPFLFLTFMTLLYFALGIHHLIYINKKIV